MVKEAFGFCLCLMSILIQIFHSSVTLNVYVKIFSILSMIAFTLIHKNINATFLDVI